MNTKSTIRLIPVLGLTFAAGWSTHWLRTSTVAHSSHNLTGLSVTASNNSSFSPATVSATLGAGDREREIRPLNSLEEIFRPWEGYGSGSNVTAVLQSMDLLPRLLITDAATVRRLLEEMAGDSGTKFKGDVVTMVANSLLFRWMLLQPEDAIRYLLQHQHEDLMLGAEEMAPLLIAWVERNRAGAGRRLLAEMAEEDREALNEVLSKQALLDDPVKTLQDPAVLEMLDASEVQSLATLWFGKDSSGLLAWRAALPQGVAREVTDSAILDSIAGLRARPADVAAKLGSLPSDLADRARLKLQASELSEYHHVADQPSQPPPDPAALAAKLAEVGARQEIPHDELSATTRAINDGFISNNQFADAALWLASMPEKVAAPDECVQNLVSSWAQKDSAAASSWIDTLPYGHLRDQATNQLVATIQEEDPVHAIVWAKTISDAGDRQSAVSGVYQQWFKNDPVAASQAVQQLSPDEQQRLRTEKPDADAGKGGVIIGNAIDALIEQGAANLGSMSSESEWSAGLQRN